MAAISALLMASGFTEADVFVGPHSYVETIELIDTYAKHLNRVELGRSPDNIDLVPKPRGRILLIDSCTPAGSRVASAEFIEHTIHSVADDKG